MECEIIVKLAIYPFEAKLFKFNELYNTSISTAIIPTGFTNIQETLEPIVKTYVITYN